MNVVRPTQKEIEELWPFVLEKDKKDLRSLAKVLGINTRKLITRFIVENWLERQRAGESHESEK